MGNLHDGHMKLVDEAKARPMWSSSVFSLTRCSSTARKIGTLSTDLARGLRKAEQAQSDLVFAPSVKEIYPNGTETHTMLMFPVFLPCWKVPAVRGILRRVDYRQQAVQSGPAGHRLLGEKDFQQLALIRKMVADMGLMLRLSVCQLCAPKMVWR